MKSIINIIIILPLLLSAQSNCVSGNCYHGKGYWKDISGFTYNGNFKNGEITGEGKLIYSQSYKSGDKLGRKSYMHIKDAISYEGEVLNSQPNGKGKLIYNDGTVLGGTFKKGDFSSGIYFSPNNVDYILIGDFIDFQLQSPGTIEFYNGDKYIGEIKDNLPNGKGTMYYPTKSKDIGFWKDGIFLTDSAMVSTKEDAEIPIEEVIILQEGVYGATGANKTTGIQGLTGGPRGGSIKGRVLDESSEGFPFVNVALYQNENIKGGATTDFDGAFKISNIAAGTYDLEIKFVGYQTYRLEGLHIRGGKLLPLSLIKLRESGQLMEKPIIYLYPENTQEIEIQLDYDGELTHTYPKYNNGWKVTANTDGTLFDSKNKEYYALYWEGKPNKEHTINKGFVIPGEQTIDFLENSLSKLGLNRKEANEFIIYWLPKMENSPYNLIHFSTTQYEEMAKLNITPTPETLIRVMMVFKPLDNPIKIKKQNLNSMSKKRKGFTVVEWGGHPLPKSYSLDL